MALVGCPSFDGATAKLDEPALDPWQPPGSAVVLWPGRPAPPKSPRCGCCWPKRPPCGLCPLQAAASTLRDGMGRLLERREEGLTLRRTRPHCRCSGEPQRLWLMPISRMAASGCSSAYRGALLVQLKTGACRPSIAWVWRAISPAWWELRCPTNGLLRLEVQSVPPHLCPAATAPCG